MGISPLSAMPGQGFGCFANRQDENTQKGQLPSSYFSSTIRSLAESKGWNAKNKNSREKTRFLNFIFFFFFFKENWGLLQKPVNTATPQSYRHLSGRAAAGVELTKLELSQSDRQIRLDNSSKPYLTISAHKGLHLSKQLRMAWLVP